MSPVICKVHFIWLPLASILFVSLASTASPFSNEIADEIIDGSLTTRVRARSPKISTPSVLVTDYPLAEVTGPVESFIASTIRSNTRTVTPSATTTTTTTTTSTTTSTTTTTPAPTTAKAAKKSFSSSTAGTTSTAAPSKKPARIATHPPWPGEATAKPRATHAPWNPEELHRPRGPNASRYGNRNKATHAPWASASMNAYDTSSGFGYSSSQSEHLFPTKSNYAPYVYGSDAKKKSILSILDRESINNWAKEMISYLTHPFASPSSSASSSFSSSESSAEASLIDRVLKTIKSAFNKRSGEERGEGVYEVPNDTLLHKLKNASWMKRFKSSSSPSASAAVQGMHYKKNDKKFRDLVFTTLVDFLRFKRHRTQKTTSGLKPEM